MEGARMLVSQLPEYPPRSRLESALDLLFPPKCVGCGRIGRWICARCWPAVHWLGANQDDTPRPGSALERVIGVAMFEGTAREAVHALKFEGQHAIAPLLGRLMAERARAFPTDLVVPVPLHRSRRRERGYDQSAMLAKHIGRELDIPVQPEALRRTRKTRQQTTLDAQSRRENVRGAFAAPEPLSAGTILLVDDVYTTGATMSEAAGALLGAGAGRVVGVVFARAD
jgi:ComF family protein